MYEIVCVIQRPVCGVHEVIAFSSLEIWRKGTTPTALLCSHSCTMVDLELDKAYEAALDVTSITASAYNNHRINTYSHNRVGTSCSLKTRPFRTSVLNFEI